MRVMSAYGMGRPWSRTLLYIIGNQVVKPQTESGSSNTSMKF